MSLVVAYREHWRGDRRWLHNPQCYACCGTGDYSWYVACSCGEFYDEAPQEWRDIDVERRAGWEAASRPVASQATGPSQSVLFDVAEDGTQ